MKKKKTEGNWKKKCGRRTKEQKWAVRCEAREKSAKPKPCRGFQMVQIIAVSQWGVPGGFIGGGLT